jgi:hypothetical protein
MQCTKFFLHEPTANPKKIQHVTGESRDFFLTHKVFLGQSQTSLWPTNQVWEGAKVVNKMREERGHGAT